MKKCEFWLLQKTKKGHRSSEGLSLRVPNIFIVEISPDELAYIWPLVPDVDANEARFAQDPNYLIDGGELIVDGYYHSFGDFKNVNNISSDLFKILPLGCFESIRFARESIPKN